MADLICLDTSQLAFIFSLTLIRRGAEARPDSGYDKPTCYHHIGSGFLPLELLDHHFICLDTVPLQIPQLRITMDLDRNPGKEKG